MIRHLLFPAEALVYGVPYAVLQWLLRSSQPLDPEWAWEVVARNPPRGLAPVMKHWPLRPLRRLLISAKMRQDHLLGISAHYDVSNDFYKLFLDDRFMFYSCADFHRPDETLAEAQQHKADYILGLIDPKPGQKILELGCGWGSMLLRIEQAIGASDNLYGLTLSREQEAYIQEHFGFHVELADFITRDYQPEQYDVIYSIGAWEHVRPNEIKPLLGKLYAALKPGGKLVKHFFCRVNEPLPAHVAASQLYFPGSVGSSYRFHAEAFEEAGFRITHRSIHDYRPTLRAWFDNLVAHREEALRIVDVSTYNRYLTFFPASWRHFQDHAGMVTRWVLMKDAL
jgi:cyclopropane-fatty-acyl-phospholipid synthase